MFDKIDYQFISNLEGGSRTTGYVPAADISKSGVTIGTGFDLGQRDEQDLRRLNLSGDLISKLKPYLGKKGQAAQAALSATPLTITVPQAALIDKAVKRSHVELLKQRYAATGNKKNFTYIPAEAQTVIASISFQYGTAIEIRAPKFWKAATTQEWKECIQTLNHFGDAYPTRRKKEAALLGKIK